MATTNIGKTNVGSNDGYCSYQAVIGAYIYVPYHGTIDTVHVYCYMGSSFSISVAIFDQDRNFLAKSGCPYRSGAGWQTLTTSTAASVTGGEYIYISVLTNMASPQLNLKYDTSTGINSYSHATSPAPCGLKPTPPVADDSDVYSIYAELDYIEPNYYSINDISWANVDTFNGINRDDIENINNI